MTLKLVRRGEAVEIKKSSETLEEPKQTELFDSCPTYPGFLSIATTPEERFVWTDCLQIEKTNKVSRKGPVYYCTFENKMSVGKSAFSCIECDKYRMHVERTKPKW